MKKIIVLALFILIGLNCFATAQIPDFIVIDGNEYALHINPMEHYFEQNPEKRPRGGGSTALWRGYIAYFTIEEDQLYLSDLIIEKHSIEEDENGKKRLNYKKISVMEDVFPSKDKLLIEWFTGFLVIPQGERVSYVHMGYASVYERYWLIQIKKGKVLAERKYEYQAYLEFRKRQFEAFTKTEEYETILSDFTEEKGEDVTPEEIVQFNQFLSEYIINYTSEFLVDELPE